MANIICAIHQTAAAPDTLHIACFHATQVKVWDVLGDPHQEGTNVFLAKVFVAAIRNLQTLFMYE